MHIDRKKRRPSLSVRAETEHQKKFQVWDLLENQHGVLRRPENEKRVAGTVGCKQQDSEGLRGERDKHKEGYQ